MTQSRIPDLSDEGLISQFGDILHEIPELYEALRRFEIKNRQTKMPSGFWMRADWVSVHGEPGHVTRIRVGSARGNE
jgi:hypothetical protein